MKVVILGARNRGELADHPLVNDILDHCLQKYAKLMIITKSCDRGVGKIIQDRCRDIHVPRKINFEMTEFSIRQELFQEMSRHDFLMYWNALNHALVAMGEEFHILAEDRPKGNIVDLVQKVTAAHIPYSIYYPHELKKGIGVKISNFNGGTPISTSEEETPAKSS